MLQTLQVLFWFINDGVVFGPQPPDELQLECVLRIILVQFCTICVLKNCTFNVVCHQPGYRIDAIEWILGSMSLLLNGF
jgi:hypothetical protein